WRWPLAGATWKSGSRISHQVP
ncbi:unnamed protein product, partial [Allacma fusca]